MELTAQVVSLDLAKRLKELGVRQDGLYVWNTRHIWVDLRAKVYEQHHNKHLASAFTVAELGKFCPTEIVYADDLWRLRVGLNHDGTWKAYLENEGADAYLVFFTEAAMADTLAKVLIYLIENNLMKTG
jgi:hypothetical protein